MFWSLILYVYISCKHLSVYADKINITFNVFLRKVFRMAYRYFVDKSRVKRNLSQHIFKRQIMSGFTINTENNKFKNKWKKAWILAFYHLFWTVKNVPEKYSSREWIITFVNNDLFKLVTLFVVTSHKFELLLHEQ